MSSQPGIASLAAGDLFNVEGLVAFITGAGTGKHESLVGEAIVHLERVQN
jgi:hypothetical protein